MGNCGSTKKKDVVFEPAVPPSSKAPGSAPPAQVAVQLDKPVKSILKTSSPPAEEAETPTDKAAVEAEKVGKDLAHDVVSDALVKLEAMCSKTLAIQNERAAAAAAEEQKIAELAATVSSNAIAAALKQHEALAAQCIQAGCRGATARQEASHKRAIAAARVPPEVVEQPSPKLAATPTETSPTPGPTGGASPPEMTPVPSPLVAAMKAEAPPEEDNGDEAEANEWLSDHLSLMRSQSSLQRQKSGSNQRKKSGSSKGKKSRGARHSHEGGAVEAQRSVYIKN